MSQLLADQSFVSSILASVIFSAPMASDINVAVSFLVAVSLLSLPSPKRKDFLRELCYVSMILLFFVSQLPGVDPNDPSVKDLLASMQSQSEVSEIIF